MLIPHLSRSTQMVAPMLGVLTKPSIWPKFMSFRCFTRISLLLALRFKLIPISLFPSPHTLLLAFVARLLKLGHVLSQITFLWNKLPLSMNERCKLLLFDWEYQLWYEICMLGNTKERRMYIRLQCLIHVTIQSRIIILKWSGTRVC